MKIMVASLALASFCAGEIKVGKSIDYSELAFYPKRWKEREISTDLYPWVGKNVAFLTIAEAFDPKVMSAFVGKLDQGWDTYFEFTGKLPRKSRVVEGRAPIAAVPGNGLTCGAGCGYVGHNGIEANYFYTSTYKKLTKDPNAVPHLYFYEMGRNFFTFGSKHSSFRTGFAVFMRYVCIDRLEVNDTDPGTRKTIDEAIGIYAKGDLPFLKTFTNAYGLTEKQNRLEKRPTDQPVMYASAMLHLHGLLGDDWLKAFFKHLNTSKEGARIQALNWYLCASLAAGKDLAPIFVDQWRFPLTKEEKNSLSKVDWSEKDLNLFKVLEML